MAEQPEVDDVATAKAELRAKAKANRAALAVDSGRLRRGLLRFVEQWPAGWIVLFDALPGEPDLMPLLDERPGLAWALTRTPAEGRRLTLHPAGSPLETHPYGYRQPIAGSAEVPIDDVTVVCVPGLAFDRHGGRLGFGAGFYDRLLPGLPSGTAIVGVTDGFIVDHVPTAAHDVAMTHLATEIGVMELPLRSPG